MRSSPEAPMRSDAEAIELRSGAQPKRASLYFDVKRNTLDDGPGIRSVVFFKGCPLSCVWCQNPESIHPGYQLAFDANKCIGCGECVAVCPEQALNLQKQHKVARELCRHCFDCVPACPAGALEAVGRKSSELDKLLEQLLQDADFFEASGGGVTVSGGEPLLQIETVGELFRRLKQHHIHTLIETAGLFHYPAFEQQVLPYTDCIYFDLKLSNSEAHERYCGVKNAPILANFRRLQQFAQQSELELLPRVPLIPSITATEENLSGIASFMHECGVSKTQLLPYNPVWLDKLPRFDAEQRLDIGEQTAKFMSAQQLDECIALFEAKGIAVDCHR